MDNQQLPGLWRAMSYLRKRKFKECIEVCSAMLSANPRDQQAWSVKCRALTALKYVDETEWEDQGVADILLDENAIQETPRPGTSIQRPGTSAVGGGADSLLKRLSTPAERPTSSSGRPISGYARPGSASGRPMSSSVQQTLRNALTGVRPETSRPVTCASRPITASGRYVRLGTASMIADSPSEFVTVGKLDFRKYARRPTLSKILFNYLLHHENNATKALELAAECTRVAEFKDWWWKAQIGKCYYRLGLFREAEKQFQSSLRDQAMIETYLWLCKVYLRLDQPNKALEYYQSSSEKFPGEVSLILGVARVYDAIGDNKESLLNYKKALHFDSSNIESIACLGSSHFYNNQEELSLRYYRRLLQMGVENAELWNNVGLACFYSQQFDMAINCFRRALELADDSNIADIWYNIGHVGIGLGDTTMAMHAFKITLSIDPNHGEALNNLGVLELRNQQAMDQALMCFKSAQYNCPHLHEPLFNGALLMFRLGDLQESFQLVSRALDLFPDHQDSQELKRMLDEHFTT
ncbi:TRP protein for ciliary function [Pelomyxa schiedti]|nr:TRP protein for ciliary function [Pelomyxa schiedti]